jgi:magnesium-transporting ATPase (P-type)
MDPITAIGPFIFVIAVSLIREAIEDLKKTKYDRLYNNSPTLLWQNSTNTFKKVKWKNVGVGNIIKVEKNEIIPCDILVIKSSAENGFCYLETTNLDGESALKPREAIIITNTMIERDDMLSNLRGVIEVDPPNNDIYTVEGTLFLESYERCYFDINNVLLRGGRLKNVEYVYGVVLYTGKDTKTMKNIKQGSLKLSTIDTKLNIIVIYILLVVIILCIVSTVFGAFFRNNNMPNYKKGLLNADYLFYYDPDTSGTGDNVLEIIRIFAADFIFFNTLIPISVMISYQILKGIQVVIIEKDPQLKKDPEDKVKCLAMALHEDLGTIKYIFTDKTGTLTCNEMAFKACSTFRKLFDDEEEKEENQQNNSNNIGSSSYTKGPSAGNTSNFVRIPGMNKIGKKSSIAKTFDVGMIYDSLIHDMPLDIQDLSNCPFRSYKEAIMEFFLNIALNHNVLVEIDNLTGEKSYQGSNPDEVTLVSSASEMGVQFLDRSNKFMKINILGKIEEFEILYKFDFTSSRLRSSIIVRDSDNKIKLYMKGADTVILQKIDKFSIENILPRSKEHLDSFAKRGLRTLCYSYKQLGEDELAAWESNYNEIKYQAINNKSLSSKVEETISSLESGLTLLGVTALEDKLQENVKNDLQEYIEAGINVWMITGDKMDTAESIGHSCKLFNDDTEVFKIRSGTRQQAIQRMKEIMEKMKILEKEVDEMKRKGIKNEIATYTKFDQVNRENKEQIEKKKRKESKNSKESKGDDIKYLNYEIEEARNMNKFVTELDNSEKLNLSNNKSGSSNQIQLTQGNVLNNLPNSNTNSKFQQVGLTGQTGYSHNIELSQYNNLHNSHTHTHTATNMIPDKNFYLAQLNKPILKDVEINLKEDDQMQIETSPIGPVINKPMGENYHQSNLYGQTVGGINSPIIQNIQAPIITSIPAINTQFDEFNNNFTNIINYNQLNNFNPVDTIQEVDHYSIPESGRFGVLNPNVDQNKNILENNRMNIGNIPLINQVQNYNSNNQNSNIQVTEEERAFLKKENMLECLNKNINNSHELNQINNLNVPQYVDQITTTINSARQVNSNNPQLTPNINFKRDGIRQNTLTSVKKRMSINHLQPPVQMMHQTQMLQPNNLKNFASPLSMRRRISNASEINIPIKHPSFFENLNLRLMSKDKIENFKKDTVNPEDINDVSIMNLLMDKNYFENSNEPFTNLTIWNRIMNRRSSLNASNLNMGSNLGIKEEMSPQDQMDVEKINKMLQEEGVDSKESKSLNSQNHSIIQYGNWKIGVPKNSLVSDSFVASKNENQNKQINNDINSIENNQMVKNPGLHTNSNINVFINNPILVNNLQNLELANEEMVYDNILGKYVKLKDLLANKENLNAHEKNSRKSTRKEKSKSVYVSAANVNSKPNKNQKQSVGDIHNQNPKVLSNTPPGNSNLLVKLHSEKNPKGFQNIFDYYQDKIEQLEKRKKNFMPTFDFKLRKKVIKQEEPEEEELYSKNYYLINFGLIIEGASITHCLDPEASNLFWRIMKKCRSVVACRCSPLQKAEIVSFVKNKSGEITLAIGDGGNDVNMIKTANVGVGLFGKEGYQAAFNADYAVSQFKYLKRLIFYHGRYSLDRNSYYIYFFFFKNVVFTLPQFWLCFFSGFSGVNYYDQWYYLGFNSFMTTLPIGGKCIVDEDVDQEFEGYSDREILKL